jgi:hypothetical protein
MKTQEAGAPAVAADRRKGKKRSSPRKRRKETLHYVVEIADWDWSFMFA